jgi:archaemetzincin
LNRLLLVPLADVDRKLVRDVARGLRQALRVEVERVFIDVDPERVLDPDRAQYHSTPLIDQLVALGAPAPEERILGMTEGDLFVPILTFVFGEAQVGGPGAVFSVKRLRPTFYGMPENRKLLVSRAVKEALHEVGHTLGLLHCRSAECVMRASTNAREVDLKPARFCRECARSARLDPA